MYKKKGQCELKIWNVHMQKLGEGRIAGSDGNGDISSISVPTQQ